MQVNEKSLGVHTKRNLLSKFRKSTEGFTLVELIVVIAILGILAAVAIPTYSGYIKKANAATVEAAGASYLTAAQSAAVLEGTYVTSAEVTTDGKFTFTIDNAEVAEKVLADFQEFSGVSAANSSGTITTSDIVANTAGTDYATNSYKLNVTGAADDTDTEDSGSGDSGESSGD